MDLVHLGHQLVKDIPGLHPTFVSMSACLGKLVFASRMEKKLNQSELAKLANVSPETIHLIEGGSGGITDKTYGKVFAALEISNADLAEAFNRGV
jgi:DNA-binding XRE family transcriptional regulator